MTFVFNTPSRSHVQWPMCLKDAPVLPKISPELPYEQRMKIINQRVSHWHKVLSR